MHPNQLKLWIWG